ncbi:MAG: hypothetical protein H6R27_887 [Proteobacteria bacterium]|nr:hypothetical protein [Pseudomonadota bacterium]
MQPRIIRSRRWILQALCASAATTGCSLISPPLEEPPGWFRPPEPRRPVVFVHGAFGARLKNRATGVEIWPAGLGELVTSSFDVLAVPLDPESGEAVPDDVVAFDLFENAGMVEFYGALVTMLVQAGGYRRETPGTPVDDDLPRLYACLYDWRRDLSRAARGLDALIEQVRADYGRPDLQVDVVAHSSGGLLVRYYLLHGARTLDQLRGPAPDFAGITKVNRVIAIGTPELGMTRSAAALAEGEPILLNRIHAEVLATAECPFQLLPQGDDAWLVDAAGRPIAADSCDIGVWREYRMSVFGRSVRDRVRADAGSRSEGRARLELLERGFAARLSNARRFRDALRVAPVPARVPYFSVGGDCRPTQARLLIEETAGRLHARTGPEDVHSPSPSLDYAALLFEEGDGMVTRASVEVRPDWPLVRGSIPVPAESWRSRNFVCASHNQLVVNADCQRAVLRALMADVSI